VVRTSSRLGGRILAGLTLVLIVLIFAYDLAFLEPSLVATQSLAEPKAPLWAEMGLRQVRFDPDAQAIVADVNVDVFSAADFLFTPNIAVSVRRIPVPQSYRQPYLLERDQTCTRVVANDYPDPIRTYKSSAAYACRGIILADAVQSKELLYPFDHYDAKLSFVVCANSEEACWKGSPYPVIVASTRAEPRRTDHFVASFSALEKAAVTLRLERRPFLRIVTVLMFGIAVAFVGYMVMATDPKDTVTKSLSVFGSLWALRATILPDSIDVFPTVIDGAVLVMFSVVFVLVLVRAVDRQPAEVTHEMD
jgi:hypothetical protein